MYQNRQNRFVIIIFFLIVASAFFWLMMRSKAGSSPTSTTTSKASTGGKMEVTYEVLDKAWQEAKKMQKMSAVGSKGPMPIGKTPPSNMPPGNTPTTNMPTGNMPVGNIPPTNQPLVPGKVPPFMQKMSASYTREMGNKDAKVRVDAFLPMESCQGPTAMTLEKLAKEFKDKLYVRTMPLFGPAAGQVGIHCATIFINGKNYVKVEGKEVVFDSKMTHNVNMIEKAVRQAIAETYGIPVEQKKNSAKKGGTTKK